MLKLKNAKLLASILTGVVGCTLSTSAAPKNKKVVQSEQQVDVSDKERVKAEYEASNEAYNNALLELDKTKESLDSKVERLGGEIQKVEDSLNIVKSCIETYNNSVKKLGGAITIWQENQFPSMGEVFNAYLEAKLLEEKANKESTVALNAVVSCVKSLLENKKDVDSTKSELNSITKKTVTAHFERSFAIIRQQIPEA